MKTSKTGFKKMRPDHSPFYTVNGGLSPSGPVSSYYLSPEELEHYRSLPFEHPTTQDGARIKPPHKPQRPRGGPGGGAA